MADIPKLITASASGAGGLFGSIASIFQHNKLVKLQQAENERNRQFNASQADIARRYNTEMVRQQREYDDPKSVMARLSAAGINPALAFSNGMLPQDLGVGSTGIQAQSTSGSIAASPSDFSGIINFGDKIASTIDTMQGAEQKRALSQLTDLQAKWYDELTEAQIADICAGVKLKGNMGDLTIAQKAETLAHTDVYRQTLENLRVEYGNKELEGNILEQKYIQEKLETEFQRETFMKRIKQFSDQCHITSEQAKHAASFFYWQAACQAADAHLKSEMAQTEGSKRAVLEKERKLLQNKVVESYHYVKDILPLEIDFRTNDLTWKANNINTVNYVGLATDMLGAFSQSTNIIGNAIDIYKGNFPKKRSIGFR